MTAGRAHRPREVVVVVATADAGNTATALAGDYNLVMEETAPIALLGGALLRFRLVDNRPLEQVLASLAADPRVIEAQPNYVFEASEQAVAKPAKYPQYAPARIRIGEAHALARGRGVRVAIIDTDVDDRHPEIAQAVIERFDSLGGNSRAEDAHGTAVAGVVSARVNLEGVAPEAGVLSVRAFGAEGAGPAKSSSLAVIKGVDWAFAKGAKLFNMSFAGPLDPLLGKVIDAAAERGAIFVAAAGNEGPNAPPSYPAAFDDVIAVTATDDADRLYERANRGPHILIAAPGVDVLTPAPGARYELSSGTSLAAAHVSGVIALMLERNPSLSAGEARAILRRTARRVGASPAPDIGDGLLDAAGAIAAAR